MSCNRPNCCKKAIPPDDNAAKILANLLVTDGTSVTQPPTGTAEATASAVDYSKKENIDDNQD